jgi:hypothetical protein
MELNVERVDVWAAGVEDKSGALAGVLAGLRGAGADLDFVIARRDGEKPGRSVVFVTPLRGDREVAAGGELGFSVTNSLHSVRVEGDNAPGIGASLTEMLAAAQINLRGLSAAVIGTRFILYIALDTAEDADKAVAIFEQASILQQA